MQHMGECRHDCSLSNFLLLDVQHMITPFSTHTESVFILTLIAYARAPAVVRSQCRTSCGGPEAIALAILYPWAQHMPR